MTESEKFWFEYLEKNNLPKNTPYCGEFVLGSDEIMCLELTALLLSGKKQATCSAMDSFILDNEPLPKVGDNYVVTDWNEIPLAVIQTTKVDILPYKNVTWELAKLEGEDEDFASWKENHDAFFEEDSDIMGYEFTPEMPVVFEQFKLLYKK